MGCTFLDLNIGFEASISNPCNEVFVWKALFNPLNAYQFVPWISSHPRSCLRGVVITQMKRLQLTNKHDCDFYCAWSFLKTKFRARGYPNSVLHNLELDHLHVQQSGPSLLPLAKRVLALKVPYFHKVSQLAAGNVFASCVKYLQPQLNCDGSSYRMDNMRIRFVTACTSGANLFLLRFKRFK